MSQLTPGVYGGIDLLDKEDRVSTNSELTEKSNERQPDLLDKALSNVLGRFVGGHLLDASYEIKVEGSETPEYMDFDRCYFEHNLLVDLHQKPMNDTDKAEIEAEIKEKYAFAKSRGLRYLPIIGGEITPAELKEVFP